MLAAALTTWGYTTTASYTKAPIIGILANPNSADFAWQRGYNWYPDSPGQYPASKTDWYWSNGGLYDQVHVPGYTTTASYTKAPNIGTLVAMEEPQEAAAAPLTMFANPNSADFAWQRGYNWYPDTPGAYPASKTNWYWSNGGLYDQAHVPGYTTTASYTARSGQANLLQAGME